MKLGAFAAFACTALVALAGCTVVTTANPGPSDGGAASASSETPTVRKQACDAVLSCIAACPQGDTACEDACVAEGSPSAQEKLNALDDCLIQSGCSDGACAQSACAAEIRACLEDVPPSNPNPSPQSPSGPLSQQDLVGTWENLDPSAGTATSFTFNADGTYRKVFVFVDPSPTCTYFKKRTIVDDGTMKVAGDTLEVIPSDTLQTMIHCSDEESGKKTIGLNDKYTFVVSGSTLTLTDTYAYDNKTVTFTKK